MAGSELLSGYEPDVVDDDSAQIASLDTDSARPPQEHLSLEAGLSRILELIQEKRITQPGESMVISIAGGSASGKTTHAETVVGMITECGLSTTVLSGDNYYRQDSEIDARTPFDTPNWDTPQAIDFDAWMKDISSLKLGESVQARRNLFDGNGGVAIEGEEILPSDVLLVEGIFSLRDEINGLSDINVFFDVSPHGRTIRRLVRDMESRGKEGSEVLRYLAEVVEPTHDEFIEPTKENADIIIDNDYNPQTEASKGGVPHSQEKFPLTFTDSDLRKMGAVRLAATDQRDYYYHPQKPDKNSDESIRLRREGRTTVFTYKGPHDSSSEGRTRPKLELELDDTATEAILKIFGNEMREVSKYRTYYALGEANIIVDQNVIIIEKDNVRAVGDFLEIQSHDPQRGREVIEEAKSRLNIPDTVSPTLTPYGSM